MPFDAGFPLASETLLGAAAPVAAMIDMAADPEPEWAARNPDRMLAFLFVAPRDCPAVAALLTA